MTDPSNLPCLALKTITINSCKNVETLRRIKDLSCFKLLLVTGLWDIILRSWTSDHLSQNTVQCLLLQLVVVCLSKATKKTELSEGVGRGSRPRLSHFPVSPVSPPAFYKMGTGLTTSLQYKQRIQRNYQERLHVAYRILIETGRQGPARSSRDESGECYIACEQALHLGDIVKSTRAWGTREATRLRPLAASPLARPNRRACSQAKCYSFLFSSSCAPRVSLSPRAWLSLLVTRLKNACFAGNFKICFSQGLRYTLFKSVLVGSLIKSRWTSFRDFFRTKGSICRKSIWGHDKQRISMFGEFCKVCVDESESLSN